MVKPKKSTAYFEPVLPNPDFPKMERELLGYWYDEGIVKEYLARNARSKKIFSFLDGPITANNPMGVHHAWGRTYKDLWQRYKNMQGFRQRFQNGFDAQGLWVEVNVERELGLKTKADIENLVKGDPFRSIAKFVDYCKERVEHFAKVQTDQSKRLGYFMDWDHSYITMSRENNYMIWYFLKKCHERGLIYEGLDSVPWCPRCETAISNHEILTEGYRDLTHTAVFIKYPITGRAGEYLLVWTTTPWTLPANVAVAVNPKLVYSRLRIGSDILYIARDRIVPVLGPNVEVLDELSGDRLLNLTYKGPFDELPRVNEARLANPRKFHTVVDGGEFVTSEEGTGLVHIAPGAGHEDFLLGKRENLPLITVIDEKAVFLEGLGEFSGKKSRDPAPIIKTLEKNNWLFKKEEYAHRYPVCWRCSTELVFRAVSEWYIAMDPLRGKMAEITKKTTWIPEFLRERELDWIKNMDDWMISKKRYWGLALPIWKCRECGRFTVISGEEELKERAIEGFDKFRGHSPHRPWIDRVLIRCENCGEIVSRIPDVGNPWLDAGIVPFSTLVDPKTKKVSYLGDKKYWKEWFPFDFITESFPGQFKGWFYSLLAMSAVLENSAPFKNVLGHGTVLAEDGRPMHKSWGNAIEFNEGADKIGVDVMRWIYAKHDPARNLLFGFRVADEVRRTFHIPLWNIYNFFVTYATFDGWAPRATRVLRVPQAVNVLDKWILARLREVGGIVTTSLDRYDSMSATAALEEFVQDLSTWYIRRSRDRVGPFAENKKDKEGFYETCFFVLTTLACLLAPFTPFVADRIFRNLTKKDSVHLGSWPELPALSDRDELVLESMRQVRVGAVAGHFARKSANLKVRQPLRRATVEAPNVKPTLPYLALLSQELNVKEVSWKRKKVSEIAVKLETKLSKELLEEGKTRDLVREIQEARRKSGLSVNDVISVRSPWLPENKKLLSWVKSKTMAQTLEIGESLKLTRVA